MDAKLLIENGWRTIASRLGIRDNGLQRALSTYERLDEDKHDERLAAITTLAQLAGSLRRTREVVAAPPVLKYLTDLLGAAEAEKRVIAKDKAQATKEAQAAQERTDQDGEEEHMRSEHRGRLLASLHRLRGSRNLCYQFIICDAQPHCGLMVAERITSQHRAELSRVTGGSRRFLPPGTCRFQGNHFAFSMDRPVTGLVRKLQESVRYFTGQNLPIVIGSAPENPA